LLAVATSAAVVVIAGGSHDETVTRGSPLIGVEPKLLPSEAGFGPPRRVFRCTTPSYCVGPHYVTFNSYYNTPQQKAEQPFLKALVSEGKLTDAVDNLSIDHFSSRITFRAYIDNNTYQKLSGLATTDALDTHLRLAIPTGPVYEAWPTTYLYARNAKPKLIWDTTHLYGTRPFRLSYIPGSARMERRGADGNFFSRRINGNLTSGEGLALGRWPADFYYSGYVTFQLRVETLPEPVRDPNATRAIGYGRVFYPPPARTGRAMEPVNDSEVGEQFRCVRTRCNGSPFPSLNGYLNHPKLGDEADFVRAASASDYGNTEVERYHTVAVVKPGDELKVRITIDNSADIQAIGAPPLAQLIARNIRARVFIPQTAGRDLVVLARVTGANTRPTAIIDGLPVRSDRSIRLEPRPETLAALTADGFRRLPPRIFVNRVNSRFFRPGVRVARMLSPSFSKVLYVEFYVRVFSE
jgi:hypothetical protein